ncbi:MAG: hypothetical protein QM817_28410 [Archangium sp.]
MATNALLAKLNAARERFERARDTAQQVNRAESWAELRAAEEDLFDFERDVALADGLECAQRCGDIPAWNRGAPVPTILSGSGGVVLVYAAKDDADPKWDGGSVRAAGSTSPGVVVLRFERVLALRSGSPHDEVLAGHHLHGKGLGPYRAHTVVNSSWITKLRQMNAVHPQYSPHAWDSCVHYLLTFHDETFECVADACRAEVKQVSVADAARSALELVLASQTG